MVEKKAILSFAFLLFTQRFIAQLGRPRLCQAPIMASQAFSGVVALTLRHLVSDLADRGLKRLTWQTMR